MKAKIILFITNIVRSLDNKQDSGYSGRKLTAIFAIFIASLITIVKLPPADQLYALIAWQVLALLCLGIVTVEQIIKFKAGVELKKEENAKN